MGEAGPRPAPIVGALRRPLELGRSQQALQRPRGVIGDIGHEAELAAGPQDAGEPRRPFHPERSGASNAAVSARDRDGSGRCAPMTLRAATRSGSWRRRSADGCCAGRRFRFAASALAMPLTKGSTPRKPVRGRSRACAIIDSPPPKPISSATSVDRHRKQRAQLGGRGTGKIDRQTAATASPSAAPGAGAACGPCAVRRTRGNADAVPPLSCCREGGASSKHRTSRSCTDRPCTGSSALRG